MLFSALGYATNNETSGSSLKMNRITAWGTWTRLNIEFIASIVLKSPKCFFFFPPANYKGSNQGIIEVERITEDPLTLLSARIQTKEKAVLNL